MTRAIVGCETSGMIRNALRARGVVAFSVDLLPSEDDSPFHIIGDVFAVAETEWFDFGVFHPSCTYLTGSAAWAFGDGPYHQKVRPETLTGQARRDARESALADVRRLMALPYPKAIENPVGAIGPTFAALIRSCNPMSLATMQARKLVSGWTGCRVFNARVG